MMNHTSLDCQSRVPSPSSLPVLPVCPRAARTHRRVQQHPRSRVALCTLGQGGHDHQLQQQPWFLNASPVISSKLAVTVLEESGRGILAKSHIPKGELLLCVPPVAHLAAPGGQQPAGDDLVDHIIATGSYKRSWLSLLCPHPDPPGPLPDLGMAADDTSTLQCRFLAAEGKQRKGSSKAKGRNVHVKAAGFGGKSGSVKPTLPNSDGMAPDLKLPSELNRSSAKQLALVVKHNCYGDKHEDLPLVKLRGEEPSGHLGVWGPFSLLNHSCVPNAINYCVGHNMVVRAARDIAEGQEVTISYLGRPQLQPVGMRQAVLSDNFEFECSCPRCQDELAAEDKLPEEVYTEMAAGAERMRAQYEAAVQEGDREELEVLHEELRAWYHALASQFRRAMISPRSRSYVLASCYSALELLMDLQQALGLKEEYERVLGSTLKAIEAVTPGSDLHCILAARWLECQKHDSPQAASAQAVAEQAHTARYGTESADMLPQLIELNRTLYL